MVTTIMVRRILLRVMYAGKERLIEAPADLAIGRLAEIVGQAFAPVGSAEDGVRYELCRAGIPLAENDRVGRVCVSIQPGQALELRAVREREPAPAAAVPQAPPAPQGTLSGVTWVLGGRALAAAGNWGVRLWDVETQRWQAQPIVTLPVLHVAAYEQFILCAQRLGQIAIWEFDDVAQRWHGRANFRLPRASVITSLALNRTAAVAGTELGSAYWFSLPGLELERELQPKLSEPVRLLHWLDAQRCLRLYANGTLEVWRFDDAKPVLDGRVERATQLVGAVNVEGPDASWALMLFAEPMTWVWVALGHAPIALDAPAPAGRPVSVAYGAKSRTVWVGMSDGAAQAWQVNDVGQRPELRARYTLDVPGLRSLLLGRDEQHLVSVDRDNRIKRHAIQDLHDQ